MFDIQIDIKLSLEVKQRLCTEYTAVVSSKVYKMQTKCALFNQQISTQSMDEEHIWL